MKFQIGDRVKYSIAFLAQTGADKEIADMRGIVQSAKKHSSGKFIVKVLWNGETETRGSFEQYLSKSAN